VSDFVIGHDDPPPPPCPEDVMAGPRVMVAPPRRFLSGKILGTILVAAIGVGASGMSCVGQSFALRQARALEGIEQQLRQLNARTHCAETASRKD
jgi:hypothetical protein